MKSVLARLLGFAGCCMVAGSLVATADWAICLRNAGSPECEASMNRAVAAWLAAGSWASGVAIKSDQIP